MTAVRRATVLGSLFAIFAMVACSSDSDTVPSNAGAASSAMGSGSPGNGGTLSLGGTASSGGSAGLDACAAEVQTGKVVPLDMFIMLDISGSMLDPTDSGSSKWDAVKSALEAFVNDERSAGLGVGIQHSPIQKPDAPDSCSSNAECGDSGPCFLSFCWGYDLGLVQCEDDAECDVYGPCLPFAVCGERPSLRL